MIKNFITLIIALIASLVCIELFLILFSGVLKLNIDKPAYSMNVVKYRFWADINPIWGTWHESYSKHNLIKSCINVNYLANSYGARDKERSKESTKKRIVALGDSFTEGYGVSDEKRVTNLLEKGTKLEVMNFATSGGFGVTQEYLVYKNLAKQFDHQVVLIGILPFNDFYDDDPEYGKKVYSKRYKPYYVGEYPNYSLQYNNPFQTIKNPTKALLRGYTYTFNAWERLVSVLLIKLNTTDQNSKGYSGYYDYTASQLNRSIFALSNIKDEAKGKQVVFFTIPVISDFIRYKESSKFEPPLSKALKEFAKNNGITYIDLLPEMIDGNWEMYKLPCDNHWSEYGNGVVADILMRKLKGIL